MDGGGATRPLARAHLLGGFQLLAANGVPIRIPSRRARSLLAIVCLEGEAGVARERLCGLLWSDRAEEQARASLRQCLFELKAALGDLADQIVGVDRERISLRPNLLDTDVGQIRRALAARGEDDIAALTPLLAAGRLLEGLEIPGLFQDWIEQTRGAFEATLAAEVSRCLDRLEADGRWPEVRLLADACLRRDPLQETIAAAAIRAERASGQQAAAQRRFDAARRVLAEELGVTPGPALVQALSGQPPEAPVAAPSLSVTARPDADPVLAVLAFDNLSGDPALAYLSDGLSDEIQQTVAQGSDLKVIARSSSFQFRGADKAVRKVAAELQATHLLDGSVRHSGQRLRISAQLVRCDGEITLWANRFDGDLSDIFALQERIAEAVAQALKVAFAGPAPALRLDPGVYETFLRARGVIGAAAQFFDDAAAITALPMLEQVVRAEPNHAQAWELLARSRAVILRSRRRQGGYAEGHAGVVEAAETALRLDPRRGGAYGALAHLEPWGAYGAREALLQKAMSVAPNDPAILTEMSTFCWSVGRFHEALALAERACELNPLMPAARLQVAQMLTYVGDYEASIRMHQEIYRRWPRNFTILISLLNFSCSLDFWDVYRDHVDEAEHFTGWQAAYLREALRYSDALASGDPETALDIFEHYSALVVKSGTLPLNYVEALSALGFTDKAYELADAASFAHMFDPDGPLPSGSFPGTVLGRWSALNKTPRFIGLCDRLGLCAYWTQTWRWPDCVEWTPYDFKAEVGRRAVAAGESPYAAAP
jgi:TolB-like protein/two-component SAPR family response regulator